MRFPQELSAIPFSLTTPLGGSVHAGGDFARVRPHAVEEGVFVSQRIPGTIGLVVTADALGNMRGNIDSVLTAERDRPVHSFLAGAINTLESGWRYTGDTPTQRRRQRSFWSAVKGQDGWITSDYQDSNDTQFRVSYINTDEQMGVKLWQLRNQANHGTNDGQQIQIAETRAGILVSNIGTAKQSTLTFHHPETGNISSFTRNTPDAYTGVRELWEKIGLEPASNSFEEVHQRAQENARMRTWLENYASHRFGQLTEEERETCINTLITVRNITSEELPVFAYELDEKLIDNMYAGGKQSWGKEIYVSPSSPLDVKRKLIYDDLHKREWAKEKELREAIALRLVEMTLLPPYFEIKKWYYYTRRLQEVTNFLKDCYSNLIFERIFD